jgi:anti-anti-sigma regulatory factor
MGRVGRIPVRLVFGLLAVASVAVAPTGATVRTRITAAAEGDGVEVIVLDFESVPTLDIGAARMLGAVSDDLRRSGVEARRTGVVGQVHDVLATTLSTALSTLYPTIGVKVAAVRKKIAP